jgi:hypothetical protein
LKGRIEANPAGRAGHPNVACLPDEFNGNLPKPSLLIDNQSLKGEFLDRE